MPALIDVILEGTKQGLEPWPRVVVQPDVWDFTVGQIAQGRWTLFGLWGEPSAVHMAILGESVPEIGVISLDCPEGRFASVGKHHAPAIRLERAIHDLAGLEPEGALDARPWLDHGRWGVRFPLGGRSEAPAEPPAYRFLTAEGDSLHQIAVGPVHAGIIEPGHFRFTAAGETVVRLEQRLGYTHKGIEGLMAGAPLLRAAQLAGRSSGDSTVAYAYAFSRAAEAAIKIEVPPRAIWLRALMAELERLANHLGDIGAICNDASFALIHAHCGVLREQVLRSAHIAFGHRLMRDVITPGGVTQDLGSGGETAIRAMIAEVTARFPQLVELYDNTASLQDRTVTTGVLKPALAKQFGAGGYVGRASGRSFDARWTLCYPPYDELRFEVPVLTEGDVNARIWIRVREVEQALSLLSQILDRMPRGALLVERAPPGEPREGLAVVEGFRGDVLAWLRVSEQGTVERCHLRDPSWFQWPLLEAAIEGNIVADFPICNKSFNCSYSGHDG